MLSFMLAECPIESCYVIGRRKTNKGQRLINKGILTRQYIFSSLPRQQCLRAVLLNVREAKNCIQLKNFIDEDNNRDLEKV